MEISMAMDLSKPVLLMKTLRARLVLIVSGRRRRCDLRFLENARACGHAESLEAWFATLFFGLFVLIMFFMGYLYSIWAFLEYFEIEQFGPAVDVAG